MLQGEATIDTVGVHGKGMVGKERLAKMRAETEQSGLQNQTAMNGRMD